MEIPLSLQIAEKGQLFYIFPLVKGNHLNVDLKNYAIHRIISKKRDHKALFSFEVLSINKAHFRALA